MKPFLCFWILALSAAAAFPQASDARLRGYKLHGEPIVISDKSRNGTISVENVELIKLGADSFTLAADIALKDLNRSAQVDFITFQGFSINGLEFAIDEFKTPFSVEKEAAVRLPARLFASAPTLGTLSALRREWSDPKAALRLRGNATVFGRFKKFGFTFRRAVPLVVDLTIPSPFAKAETSRK